jgi:hypothetical protein
MNTSEINRVTGARVLQNHQLELRFSDGYVGQVDLAPALWGPVFEPLKDLAYFRQFRLEDDTVRWPNDADFCPDVLRYWFEAGSVQTQDATDIHFNRTVPDRAAS